MLLTLASFSVHSTNQGINFALQLSTRKGDLAYLTWFHSILKGSETIQSLCKTPCLMNILFGLKVLQLDSISYFF